MSFILIYFLIFTSTFLPFSAGAVVPWVLLLLCFPDAQLLIAGPVSTTSPPDLTDSRIPTRGRRTLCPYLCLTYQGYQGGAASFGPETGCSDQLPLDWPRPVLIRTQLVSTITVLNPSEPVRTGLKYENEMIQTLDFLELIYVCVAKSKITPDRDPHLLSPDIKTSSTLQGPVCPSVCPSFFSSVFHWTGIWLFAFPLKCFLDWIVLPRVLEWIIPSEFVQRMVCPDLLESIIPPGVLEQIVLPGVVAWMDHLDLLEGITLPDLLQWRFTPTIMEWIVPTDLTKWISLLACLNWIDPS